MTRLLPSFADLMLLPTLVDPDASVRLEQDRVVVRSAHQTLMRRMLAAYPHVAARVRGDDELVLEPLVPARARVVLVWPGGETVGVTVWPNGFVSIRRADATLDASLEGDGVTLVQCRDDETLAEALARLES